MRYPSDITQGDRLAMRSAFPWEAGFAACLRGCCAHLFPQLILVNDAFQLLCQLCVLLAELHVPLALLLDLSLDFTQRALEMISNFFPLLIFLPCPLNRFLLLNGREGSSVRCITSSSKKILFQSSITLFFEGFIHLCIPLWRFSCFHVLQH